MTAALITPPRQEPITLPEAKDHLRVTATSEDALISELIVSARQRAEVFLSRALLTQTWELYLDEFTCEITLPNPLLQSIVSIKYIDTAGIEQTILAADYTVHTQNEPGLVVPAYGKSWPTPRAEKNAITVQYIAGWTTPQGIPGPIKSAILLMIGDMYRNREDVSPEQNYKLPNSAHSLLWPYRLVSF